MDAYRVCEKNTVSQLSHLTTNEAAEVFRREFQCLFFKSGDSELAAKRVQERMQESFAHDPLRVQKDLEQKYNQLAKPGLLPNLSIVKVGANGRFDIIPNSDSLR